MSLDKQPLRTEIVSDKQRFYDKPVYTEVSRAKPIAMIISMIFSRQRARPPGGPFATWRDDAAPAPRPTIRPVIHELSGYERTPLRWMKPDGRGGLVQARA